MGNKYKGTFEITLGGQEYTLRPSFDALCEFEEKSGYAPNEAFQQMADGKMSPKVIASAIWAGIKGEAIFRNEPSYEKGFRIVGELIMRDGITKHIVSASKFFQYGIIPFEDLEKAVLEDSDETEKKSS